jgi:hypothetical protein
MNAVSRLTNGYDVAPNGCWVWRKATDPNGYGRFWFDGRMLGAHRVSYQLLVGPVPEGLDLDHLCRNRRCVNPSHLEPVTRRTNLVRGDTLVSAHVSGADCGNAKCVSCRWKRDE